MCVRMVYIKACMFVDAIRYRWQGKVRLSFSSEMSAEYCYCRGIRDQSSTTEPLRNESHFCWISPHQPSFSLSTPIDSSLLDGVSLCVRVCIFCAFVKGAQQMLKHICFNGKILQHSIVQVCMFFSCISRWWQRLVSRNSNSDFGMQIPAS